MAQPDLIFIGIRGSVLALDKLSGRRVWETKLKGSSFVTLLVEDNCVLAGAQGELFCLAANNGNILWQDGLKVYGFGLISIATANGSSDMAAIAAEHNRQQQASTSAAAGNTAAIG